MEAMEIDLFIEQRGSCVCESQIITICPSRCLLGSRMTCSKHNVSLTWAQTQLAVCAQMWQLLNAHCVLQVQAQGEERLLPWRAGSTASALETVGALGGNRTQFSINQAGKRIY